MISSSCDPQNEDPDDYSLGDAFEANAGGSACSVSDADGDGFDDAEELSLGTDRRDPTAFLAAPGVTVGFSAARQD